MPNIYHMPAPPVLPGEQHVFIAMPIGAPTLGAAMVSFAWNIAHDLMAKGIPADLYLLEGHCHVDDARNLCIWEFLRTACTDFLFIDSDVAAGSDAVSRIVSFNRDVIAGVYPYKDDTEAFPVRLLADQAIQPEPDGAVEVEAVPTGFLRMRRSAVERLAAAGRSYHTKEVTKESRLPPIPLIFERDLDDVGERWGGDYNFCRKWRALGGQVFVDPTIHFRHHGLKGWCGNLAIHWGKAHQTQTPAFDETIVAIRGAGSDVSAGHFGRLVIDWGNKWSAQGDLLYAAWLMAREADGRILEAGSGLSTIVLGLAGKEVHALEHDLDHFKRTQAALNRYKLENVCLHYAPLRLQAYDYGRRSCLWYEIPAELPGQFAFVLCDGPPRRFGRAGLFKLLGHAIEGAKVLLDDCEHLDDLAEIEGRQLRLIASEDRTFGVMLAAQPKISAAA